MVHGHGFDWLLSRDNLSREHGRISMHLPNVYVHRGALFPTFCILVFGEIKFYRNQLLSIVSPSSVDRLKSFLRNDQRFVVGERHLRFSYSSSSLFLKIIPAIFLNFKFPKGEDWKEKYSIGENVLCALLHGSQRSRHQRVVDVVSCVPFAGGGGGWQRRKKKRLPSRILARGYRR